MNKVKYLILGAGPTGLGAAYRLKELGIEDFLVLDKESKAGGLAASFIDEKGFTWDLGGHVQFSHYSYFDRLMLKALGDEGWLNHQRESWVWIRNTFVPYPFQNNIKYLPKDEMWKCLQGIIQEYKKQTHIKPTNFKEWILATFGLGLAEVFMYPYNFKVWAYPLEMLNYSWIGERVAITDLERLTKNILFDIDDYSWGPNNTFQFPKYGGTGSIWLAVQNLVGIEKFRFEKNVIEVNSESKTVKCLDGTTYSYQYLISTIPINILTERITPRNNNLIEKTKNLLYSSSHIIGFGLKGKPREELKTKCWMYFPENDNPFYRVTVFSNYSPNNVPDIKENWSLMAEVSESEFKTVNQDTIIDETIEGLINTKLIQSKDEIVSVWYKKLDYGYPTPSLERDSIINSVIPILDNLNIYSRGRFGAWKYEVSNQDHSLMQGVEIVNKLELDVEEVTLFAPNLVNSMWAKK